ncbi:FadR/GntR family transcriptional regulator [Bowmanella dokdonensis]|uniref:FadR family transcriptional regulator n=1 Tax=Bowmanella dokdonensis TaxID=751969 RepID=A0A939DQU8_9ALTE|nr:FadR/GntR family transcriptional regulator [Bowmanella dokdonensis]MBN7827137.1 FadR family transcriptional regulator [Bowmanella dokdonensis]
MLQTTNNNNLTQQLVYELGKAIVREEFAVGEGLPSEAEICTRYQISRTATREAVKMLASKGLLVSRPRKGITVQSREYWNLFDPDVLDWILSSTPSLKTLRDFLQLRLAIEPEAAALAAKNANPEDLKTIGEALSRMKAAEDGMEDPLKADIDFHSAILRASKNPFFVQLRSFIETALKVSIRFTNQFKGVDTASYLEHRKIYDAIAAGDPQLAHQTSYTMESEALQLIEERIKA